MVADCPHPRQFVYIQRTALQGLQGLFHLLHIAGSAETAVNL
jgi:hypothetical protein